VVTRGSVGSTTKERGDAGEARALAHLLRQGLTLVQRNYRVARGPNARGGEVDLILRERDGTLVFVEVRTRRSASHGGAAASVSATKQRHLVFAAQHYLSTLHRVVARRVRHILMHGRGRGRADPPRNRHPETVSYDPCPCSNNASNSSSSTVPT
jgi:putative endonuclease